MPSGRLSEGEVHDQVLSAFRSGSGAIVTAPGALWKIVVYGFQVVASAAGTVQFQSAANNKTPAFSLAANGGMVVPPGTIPLFECNENEALNLVAAAGADVLVQYAKARV